jgi:lysophospholipase L1-like esterase
MNIEIKQQRGGYSSSGGIMSMTPLGLICGWISLCCYAFPRLSKCIVTIGCFALLSFVASTIFNPTVDNHKMGADYSAINSAYDLSLSKVDHWCVRGDNDSCRCEDPLEPSPRAEFKSWNAAHKANVAEVNLYRALFGESPSMIEEETGKPRAKIDVAFLGESVVEAMDGRWLGKHIIGSKLTQSSPSSGKNFPMINETFEKLFRKPGGDFEGVALGIAGDTTSNVLWRIMNDEMPYDFNPKVWWLVLGMNDLTRMQCSEEIVVLGILRVVEEIRLRKPDAKIVINSLLPMINYQDGDVEPKMADVADFLADRASKRYRGKEDRYREERKREVPGTFKVRGGNDDQVDNDGGDGGKGHHRLLRLKQKEDESDEEFEERRMRKTRKKRNKDAGGEDGEEQPKAKLTKKQREEAEDNATDGPELEKAIERKKKKLDKEDKKIRDKVFKDDEKYHPKKSVSKFLPMIQKKVLPPVWPSVHLINDKLKQFCAKHDSITFFDATEFFASKEEGGRHHLYNELISPRGHPTELGFQRWELEIRDRLKQLIPPESDKPAHISEKNTEQWGEDDVIDDEGDNEGVELISSGLTQEEGTDDAPPKGAFANDDEYGGKVVVSPGLTQEEGTDDAPPKGAFANDDEYGGKEVVSPGLTQEEGTDDAPPKGAFATDDEDGAKEDKSGEIVAPARSFKKDD